ncbi:hypothetical protein [Myxosarcina sp. GI1]|uniref:NACHT C-terminal alpha/beta 1 domain-containing protein n=1 Tax=Myxosarcina sp. GI1 TaxID=1541065 RepID=UPI00155AF491|nr:hypothetical protein [Myxosarcina sp. GI1]
MSQERLPTTKAELYQGFVSSFYDWNQRKVRKRFTQTELNIALGKLALQAIDRNESRFRLKETFIGQYLEESLFEVAQNLGWLNQVGVAAENPTEKVYAFYHPTFEEYFAACAIDNWHFFLNHVPTNPTKGTYRIFEPHWKEITLLWLGRENVSVEQKENLIKALVKFGDECTELYGNQAYFFATAYFLAGAATAEFLDCSLKKQIIEKIVELSFGHFNFKTRKWKTFFYYIRITAKKALKEANYSDVATALLNKIFSLGDVDDFYQYQEHEHIFSSLFWCLNEFEPQHSYVIEKIIHWIDNIIVWDEQGECSINNEFLEITEWLPFSRIEVSNSGIIKAILNFLNTGYKANIKIREYHNKLSSLENSTIIEERILKEKIGLTKKLELAAKVFEVAGDTLVDIVVGDGEVVELLIDILKSEAENNFEYDLYLKILKWLNSVSPQNKEALRFLSEVIDHSNDRLLCYKTAKALLKLEPKNQKAFDILDQSLDRFQNEAIKIEISLELIKIDLKHYQAINYLFEHLKNVRPKNSSERNDISKIITEFWKISDRNESVFENLIKLIENNCNNYVCTQIILRQAETNSSQEIFNVLGNLFQNHQDRDVRYVAALEILKINPNNLEVINFLIDWCTYIQEDFSTDIEKNRIYKIFIQNPKTIESLIQILQTYQNKNSLEINLYKHKLKTILWLLEGVGNKTGNAEVITILTNLLENIEQPEICCIIAQTLGKISLDNSLAIDILIKVLSNNKERNIRSRVINSLEKIGYGSLKVVDYLLKQIVESNGSVEFNIKKALIKNIKPNRTFYIVSTIKNYLIVKEEYYLDEILWHCAQNMSYPEFHRAWHNTTTVIHPEMSDFTGIGANLYTLNLNLENLPLQLKSSINKDGVLNNHIQIICINQSQISDRDNPAVEIYDQMLKYGCSERDNGELETMLLLKSYWHSLQRNTEKLMVLVFYDSTASETEWTGFRQSILDPLNTFEGAICVITDQPASKLKQFSPSSPNLIENLMGWMRKIYLES